jgi:hypothetical protein
LAYIGNIPAESYASFETETFSVSATANYTLSHAVTNENEIRLVINGVVQQPGSGKAYTASGVNLVLSSATVSGDSMYAVYLGRALQTVNPPSGSVGTAQLSDDAVSSAKIASGVLPTNTPAFESYKSSNQDISDATYTKVSFGTELFDPQSTFASDKFTPAVSGKYNLYSQIMFETPGGHEVDLAILAIYKNGSRIKYGKQDLANDSTVTTTITCSTVVDSDTNDYFEVYAYLNRTSGGTIRLIGDGSNGQTCSFGAYRIIT